MRSPGQFSVVRNSTLNLAAQVLSIAIAFASVPLVVRHLGNERFGVLTILWAFVGYFSVFDLGSGIGVLKYLPESLARGETRRVVTVIKCSMLTSLGIGLLSALLASSVVWIGAERFVTVPPDMLSESHQALILLAVGLPAVLLQVPLRGVMMSFNRYDVLNGLQLASGLLQWGGAALVVTLGGGLIPVVALTVASRYLILAVQAWFSLQLVPELVNVKSEQLRHTFVELLRFGGWVSVPQLVAPLFTLLERLIIGMLLSLAWVTFFSVPNDTMIRLLIFPVSVVGAILPVLSGAWAVKETREYALRVYRQALKVVTLVMLPGCVLLAAFSQEILTVWMGAEFAGKASLVFTILSVGLFFNAIAQLPNAALLAVGRPDIPGRLQLVQVPLYITMLYVFTAWWGITGAALAWGLRVIVEMAALLFFARSSLQVKGVFYLSRTEGRGSWITGGGLLAILAAKFLPFPLFVAVALVAAGLVCYCLGCWFFILNNEERRSFLMRLAPFLRSRPDLP